MNSPRYSSPANHIKAQIRKALAIHRDREPEAANMMEVSGTVRAGLEAEARSVSMDPSALRSADAELSDHCRARYTIAPPFPEACSRKMTGVFRLAAALLAALAASGEAVSQTYPVRPIRFLVGSPP